MTGTFERLIYAYQPGLQAVGVVAGLPHRQPSLEWDKERWGRLAVTGLADHASLVLWLCSHRDEFNIQVLHAFVELHEFTDLNLVQALR